MAKNISAMRDPVGSVLIDGRTVKRGINIAFASYYQDVLEKDYIQKLLGKKIVPTKISKKTLKGFEVTLEHPLIEPRSYAYEWSQGMLFDAAVLTLELCIALNKHQNTLKDANPWNIQFENSTPLLVDFGSIMPVEDDLLWVAYDQFMRTFLFPLLLGKHLNGRIPRAMFLANQDGISPQESAEVLPKQLRRKYPWLRSRLYTPLKMMRLLKKTGQEDDIVRISKSLTYSETQRDSFFKKLLNDTLSLETQTKESEWSQYYESMDSFFNPPYENVKQKTVNQILEKTKPKSVVDMGCNVGGYSILAAQSGAKVTAFDTDEVSIQQLYELSKQKNLQILPLVGNVLYPSPSSGWQGNEFPEMASRLTAEMGFALALEHHLAISQNQTFARIVETFSSFCEKWLLTEFIPIEDPRVQELLLTNRRNLEWYSLENFKAALNQKFKSIESFPSHPKGRTLLFCTK